MKIGIVAGETSGDALGADLISHLRQCYPNAQLQGVGGDKMIGAGFDSLFDMDRLAVMGFIDPLKRLPELLRMRHSLLNHFLKWQADLVVGIDSPDFNLGLELKLRRRGVLTAHYVSPTVWAWRQGRVKTIARAVDRMLTLFPFESDFYERHRVPVSYVGHPLADVIPMEIDTAAARQALGLRGDTVLAVMPGSRAGEIGAMAGLFFQVCRGLQEENPRIEFIVPAANPLRHRELAEELKAFPDLNLTLVAGDSHRAMAASDAVLLTSGTTALEAMLFKKPMVVAYRMGAVSFGLLSLLVKTPFIALPNLIAGRSLVPELIQSQATVDNLITETRSMLYDSDRRRTIKLAFAEYHRHLARNAGREAATILAGMIDERRKRRIA